jgi:hypothetical protein
LLILRRGNFHSDRLLGFGRIEIFTKPGTDKWRGSFNYNNQNELWNSRNPYAATKPPLRLNEFEGGVSGRLNHRASLTFDWGYENVKNGSIVNAVVLNSALLQEPFSAIRTTPQARLQLTPRVDYQLGANHTLTVRYGITRLDVTDAGIGSFDLVSRGYHLQTTNQTVQATESAVLGAAVNETRVQYFRSANEAVANSSSPAILVLRPDRPPTRRTAWSRRTTLPPCTAHTPSASASASAARAWTAFPRRTSEAPSPSPASNPTK